jgi:hypothetical protein
MSFLANVFLGKCLLGKCRLGKYLSGQMSFWAYVVWANVLLVKRCIGKCLWANVSGQTSPGQMSWIHFYLLVSIFHNCRDFLQIFVDFLLKRRFSRKGGGYHFLCRAGRVGTLIQTYDPLWSGCISQALQLHY